MGFEVYVEPIWAKPEEADRHIAWMRDAWSDLQAFSPGGAYLNRSSDLEDQAGLQRIYGAKKYQRLVALKDKYDPTNFFRLNQNFSPTG